MPKHAKIDPPVRLTRRGQYAAVIAGIAFLVLLLAIVGGIEA